MVVVVGVAVENVMMMMMMMIGLGLVEGMDMSFDHVPPIHNFHITDVIYGLLLLLLVLLFLDEPWDDEKQDWDESPSSRRFFFSSLGHSFSVCGLLVFSLSTISRPENRHSLYLSTGSVIRTDLTEPPTAQ